MSRSFLLELVMLDLAQRSGSFTILFVQVILRESVLGALTVSVLYHAGSPKSESVSSSHIIWEGIWVLFVIWELGQKNTSKNSCYGSRQHLILNLVFSLLYPLWLDSLCCVVDETQQSTTTGCFTTWGKH